ncbi:MAG: CPBP family intramembrane metalloprotease [Anaerolineales bacterium]|nr:CPBP family intramembrane metalloprotease [Anaerolineales bacterium]
MSLSGLDQAILKSFFNGLPDWFQINQFVPANYSQPVLTVTFALFLILNGFVGPVVEELYFRGFLLPRIEYMKGWAPLVNVLLFSVYHFFSPWQNITRILAFVPLAYVVRWKKNIYVSMLAHVLLNIGHCMLTAHLFLSGF